MKRFIQVVLDTTMRLSGDDLADFEDRCSCAVACGYIPCGNTLQTVPVISGNGSGSDGDLDLDITTSIDYCMIQNFYDPEGKATPICAHCTKCETCSIAPEEDTYCSEFEDVCYKEDE